MTPPSPEPRTDAEMLELYGAHVRADNPHLGGPHRRDAGASAADRSFHEADNG